MALSKKIATCCYCGTRAVLVLDKTRHELSCGACGAPLHDMKFMPQPSDKEAKKEKKSERPLMDRRPVPTYPVERFADYDWRDGPARPKKRKKRRKPLLRRVAEEIWDVAEDFFD